MHDHHCMTTHRVIQQKHAHAHRLRDVEADVMHCDGSGGRDHDTPITIDQQKRERGEHVEVCLDHAVGLMNEHGRIGHEAGADGEARERRSGGRPRQPEGA